MIRTLLTVAAVGFAGTVGFPQPASRWFEWAAITAALLAVVLLIWKAEASWRAYSEQRRDARRRNAWR